MAKEEWGTKRVCPTTGKRFYDLNRDPIVSPYTGEVVEIEGSKPRTTIADKSSGSESQGKQEDQPAVLEDSNDDSDVNLGDDVLEEDDDNVSLDDLTDVASEDSEN